MADGADFHVDLKTRIIDKKTRIWIVHPGKGRRYYEYFRDESLVFLEYPGLDLTASALKNVTTLRQRIRYSAAISSAGSLYKNGSRIDPNSFPGTPDTDVTTPLRTIRHLYGAAKVGDLVIVPGRGAYSATLFGEIVSDFDPSDVVTVARYDYAPLHVRRVRWVSTDRIRNELPRELAKLFEKPPAVAEVQRNQSTDRFFDFAYRSYVKGEEGWSLISADGYNGKDPRALIAPDTLISLSIALYNAGSAKADLKDLSLQEIIDRYYSVEDIDDFTSKFTSPGKYGFKASAAALAVFVTVSVATLTHSSMANHSDSPPPRVYLTNSAGGGQDEIISVTESLNFALTSMNPAALKEAADLGARASRDVQLKSDATVVVSSKTTPKS